MLFKVMVKARKFGAIGKFYPMTFDLELPESPTHEQIFDAWFERYSKDYDYYNTIGAMPADRYPLRGREVSFTLVQMDRATRTESEVDLWQAANHIARVMMISGDEVVFRLAAGELLQTAGFLYRRK